MHRGARIPANHVPSTGSLLLSVSGCVLSLGAYGFFFKYTTTANDDSKIATTATQRCCGVEIRKSKLSLETPISTNKKVRHSITISLQQDPDVHTSSTLQGTSPILPHPKLASFLFKMTAFGTYRHRGTGAGRGKEQAASSEQARTSARTRGEGKLARGRAVQPSSVPVSSAPADVFGCLVLHVPVHINHQRIIGSQTEPQCIMTSRHNSPQNARNLGHEYSQRLTETSEHCDVPAFPVY